MVQILAEYTDKFWQPRRSEIQGLRSFSA